MKNRRLPIIALTLVAVTAGAEPLTADFGVKTGVLRPELHSSGFGPTICSQTAQDLDDMKAMGFKASRTHDWALINPGQRVCDYFHIFPLMHLDAKDPKNYVFGPTDYLLKRTREELGTDIFYRLGTSIEHSGKMVHFNARIPEDFDKVVETFAGTVRHYNRGWANGYKWNIKYWEIWNEPDGNDNMWCLPDGDESDAWIPTPEDKEKAARRRKLFAAFFVKALKRLKHEFGDEIKVGGPAMCAFREEWFRPIIEACLAEGVAPDFISWHGYRNDIMGFNQDAEASRKMLDGYGLTNCTMIVNEWHYFGHGDYGWDDMQHCSDPKVKARIWTGPRSHNGIHASCFTLATLANLQRSLLDQAYYYGCRHTGSWGFKDEYQAKYKVFYALKLFGDLLKSYRTMCESTSEGAYTTLAVKSEDGRKAALLVVDYGGKERVLNVGVKGLADGTKAKCTLLDYTHDLVEHPVGLVEGKLTLEKPDGNSAAFLIEFE